MESHVLCRQCSMRFMAFSTTEVTCMEVDLNLSSRSHAIFRAAISNINFASICSNFILHCSAARSTASASWINPPSINVDIEFQHPVDAATCKLLSASCFFMSLIRRSGVAKYRVSEQEDTGEHGCSLRFCELIVYSESNSFRGISSLLHVVVKMV